MILAGPRSWTRLRCALAAFAAIMLMTAVITPLPLRSAAAVTADSPAPWSTGDPTFTPISQKPPIVGVNYHGMWSENTDSIRAQMLDKFAAAGVKNVRLDVAWATLQPSSRNSYDMNGGVAQIDKRLNEIAARGMTATVMLYWPPKWSSGTSSKSGEPANYADFGNALAWAANRWKTQAPVWEMWNEPDLDSFWASKDPVKFANMIKVAYPIAKAANPNTTFLLGAPTHLGLAKDWHKRMYAAGIKGHYDAIAVHPYMSPSNLPPDGNATGSARKWSIVGIADLRTIMAANGEGSMPIWATEFGWSTHEQYSSLNHKQGVTEAEQSTFTLAAYYELAKQGVIGAQVYTDRDMVHSDLHEAKFGLLNRDLSPKPAYYALKCAASNICGPSGSYGSSGSSGSAGVTTGGGPKGKTPAKPKRVRAAVISRTSIRLLWRKTPGAKRYNIQRAARKGGFTRVASVRKTTYVDRKLLPGKKYRYVVRAVGRNGAGPPSAVVARKLGPSKARYTL